MIQVDGLMLYTVTQLTPLGYIFFYTYPKVYAFFSVLIFESTLYEKRGDAHIDGLMRKRRYSSYVLFALSHQYQLLSPALSSKRSALLIGISQYFDMIPDKRPENHDESRQNIIMTSWWARWRLKSPAYRLFTQTFLPALIKENIRVTGHCGGNSPVTSEFPTQRASNAGNVSIWWRHHEANVWLYPVNTTTYYKRNY